MLADVPAVFGRFRRDRLDDFLPLFLGEQSFRFSLTFVFQRIHAVLHVDSSQVKGMGFRESGHPLDLYMTVSFVKHEDGLGAKYLAGLFRRSYHVFQFVFLFSFERFHGYSIPQSAISWCDVYKYIF